MACVNAGQPRAGGRGSEGAGGAQAAVQGQGQGQEGGAARQGASLAGAVFGGRQRRPPGMLLQQAAAAGAGRAPRTARPRAHLALAAAAGCLNDLEGQGEQVALHCWVGKLLSNQALDLAHRVARVGGQRAHCTGRGRGGGSLEACVALCCVGGWPGAGRAARRWCRRHGPATSVAATELWRAVPCTTDPHLPDAPPCRPASVPMKRVLEVKATTLDVSRLDSLLSSTSTPAAGARRLMGRPSQGDRP